MKKIVPFLTAFLIIVAAFLLGAIFLMGRIAKQEPHDPPVAQTAVAKEEQEPAKEEKKEEPPIPEETIKQEEEPAVRKEDDGRPVYKMLDFDRRLILDIGIQDRWLCSIFDLAYARAILDGSFKVDPYDYYDGEGAVWRWAGFEDVASSDPLNVVLKRAYDEIDAGRPTILFVSGTYAYTSTEKPQSRTSEDHYVLILGYRKDADREDLKPSDFYGADPSGGYCCDVYGYVPWVTLSDEGPALVSGEYALYAQSDPEPHLKTCFAHADTVTWDGDRTNAIHPDHID